MNYGRYCRWLAVLAEQNRDFAAAEGRMEGRLKIETGNNRGAMRCSVENLRPYARGDYLYKLILFGVRGERTIHAVIGTIPVGRGGRGEAYFRFDPLDVNGKGDEYGYFTTAIVAAMSTRDRQEPLHPVLKGATGNEPGEPRQGRERGEDRSGDEVRAASCGEPDGQDGPGLSGTAEGCEGVGEPDGESAGLSGAAGEPGGEGPRLFNRFYNESILRACAHTCQAAEYYEEVRPFERDRTGARWKKILNIASLPLVSPGARYFASLYHHYLFGARPDERGYAACYFFAVPGRDMEAEQPDGGQSGFVYWQPMKGSAGQKNPYGYWIVEIDGQTGDIREVFPLKS